MPKDVSTKISDESVQAKTGKVWSEWFSILDEFNCAAHGHTATAKFLSKEHGVPTWWAQTITVRYELDRGLRLPGQRPSGFEASVQRLINVPVSQAFAAWAEAEHVARWFTTSAEQDFREGGRYGNADGDAGEYRRIVLNKLIRFTWEQKQHSPGSVVDVSFTPKQGNRVQVRITHARLKTSKDADDLREGWSWAIDSLKSYLETGSPITWEDWQAAKAK
jgi:uncharacterized protein YndB with AHSA1/START domain